MKSIKLEVVYDDLRLDDSALQQAFFRLDEIISTKEAQLKQFCKSAEKCQNNYLQHAMTRLAYGFAKEQYESVYLEMQKRGLITG